jgi:hypothetical protein
MKMRSAALALAAVALCACGGGAGRLRPDVPAGVDLTGTWRLDRAASDDPQAMVETMRRKLMKHVRRRDYLQPEDDADWPDSDDDDSAPAGPPRRGPGGGGTERGPDQRQGGGPGGAGGRFRPRYMPGASYTRALGPALTSDTLTIEQSADRFVLIRGDDRRSFTPGGTSVVGVAEGVADQSSGWSGREFVIEVRPQVGPHVIERYGLSADGHRLVEHFTLTDVGLPKLEFTRQDDRGSARPRPLPTSN